MVLFVNALGGQASFVISLAALTPVQGVTWTYTGLPTIAGSGVSFSTSDDTGITFSAFQGFTNNLTSMSVRATLEDSSSASATFNISSGSGATLPPINPAAVLPVTSGLVAQYDAASWNATLKTWLDKSGNGNNTSPSDVRGTITYDVTNGFLYGSVSDGLKFPSLGTNADYTVIHLAKYNNGVKKRIFQGVSTDWASGFYSGKSGVAYHNGYITAPVDLYNYNWVISSDQKDLYRAHSVDFTTGTSGSPGFPSRIGLNFGQASTEYSDWAVGEVIIYNRKLTAAEMLSVENYIRVKYPSLTIQIDSTTGASFTIPQSNQLSSVGTVTWTYKTPLPTGVSFAGSSQTGAVFTIATGTYLNNQNLVVNASGNGGGGSRSIYLLSASRALLTAPNVAFNTAVAGSFTILQTASGTGGVTWAYSNLPASVTFLSQSDSGLTFTVAQNAVVPTRVITVTATNGVGTPTVASFNYGSGVKPVLSVGTVSAIDSTTQQTFLVPQTVVDGLTGGITWSYSPTVDKFPAGLTVSPTLTNNQGATFVVAQNAVIAPQTITVTATNIGGVATSISFTVGAAVKPVLSFTNQLLDTQASFKQFSITVQEPSLTYSGGISWSYTLPVGLTVASSSSGIITFQAARGVVIVSQTFAVTATNSIGLQTVASFTLGAGTQPLLSDPSNGTGERILDTTSVNISLTITQSNSRTGAITWTTVPSTFPTGVSVSSQTDFGFSLLFLQKSVFPFQPFRITASAATGWSASRTFNLGASTLVQLSGPGDPQLIDTTTQQTVRVSQDYDPAYTGPVAWTIVPSTYPAGVSITTQDDSKTIFTFSPNSYLLRQQFTFSARSIGGNSSTIRFDIGAAVRPTLSSLANQVLDTSTALKTFTVNQQVATAYTGPITWIVTPATLPGGITRVTSDSAITFTVPQQTASTGVVTPASSFSVTAKANNTDASSTPTTFTVFAPRLPVMNPIPSSITDVSTTAYTYQATQSKTDATPITWSITKSDNSPVPSGVSIDSTSGLVTVAVGTYLTATVLKVTATNAAGASSSTTFTITTPEPPAISTTPTSPQIRNVTAGPNSTITFTLTNASLAGTIAWSFGTFVPPTGVTIGSTTGTITILKDSYFASTTFTIRARNTDTGVYRERTIVINTPQTPAINPTTPASPQILNVTSTLKTFTFTNTVPLAEPVEWSLTTNPQPAGDVSIDQTGKVTVKVNKYFLWSTFVVQASNAAINVVNTRSFVINAPAPPAFTATYASGVYVNTTAADATLPFTSTEARADPVAWTLLQSDGVTAAPAGVTINGTTGAITVTKDTSFIGLGLKVMASNAAISSTTSLTPYFVSAPKTPVLNTTLTIPTPTYKPIVVVGGVTSVTSVNSAGTSIPAQANQTYTSVDSTATSGSGGGATFTVTRNGSGAVTVGLVSVAFYGLGYVTGNTVKILGTALGGTTPANDVTITVAASTAVYMNNAASNVIQVSQTASPTGTITWGGVSSLPAGVNVTTIPATNSLLSVTVTSGTVVRPKLSLTVSAAGPALQGLPSGLVSGNVVFDIFTPLRPIIGTPADNTNYSFDTTSTSKTVTVAQDAAQLTADTGPITWEFVSPTYTQMTQAPPNGYALTVVFTPRNLIITIPQGTYGITGATDSSYVPITVRAINLAKLVSTANKTFNLYVPKPPEWEVKRDDNGAVIAVGSDITFDSSTAAFTITVTQKTATTPINYDGITYTDPVSPITLTTGTATISRPRSPDEYKIEVSKDAVTSGQSITFSAKNSTNDMNRTVTRSINFICSGPPVIADTGDWTPPATFTDVYEFDTKTAAITIDAKYTSGLPLATITTGTLPTGLTFVAGSSTSTKSTFTIAKEANIDAWSTELKLATAAMASGTYATKTFTIKAATPPALGAPSQTGAFDTTTAQTITITAATTPKSVVTDWTFTADDGSVLSDLGITVTKVTGDTSGGLVKLTINIAKSSSFAARDFTATAKTCVSTITGVQKFSLSAAAKPVISASITYPPATFPSINTASSGTYGSATVTSGSTPVSWSISGPLSINSSGSITWPQWGLWGSQTITVSASINGITGQTTFTLQQSYIGITSGSGSFVFNNTGGLAYHNILVVGGGGGGGYGGVYASLKYSGGGGGSGGVDYQPSYGSFSGTTWYYDIGPGGAGGTSTSANGGAGTAGTRTYFATGPPPNVGGQFQSAGGSGGTRFSGGSSGGNNNGGSTPVSGYAGGTGYSHILSNPNWPIAGGGGGTTGVGTTGSNNGTSSVRNCGNGGAGVSYSTPAGTIAVGGGGGGGGYIDMSVGFNVYSSKGGAVGAYMNSGSYKNGYDTIPAVFADPQSTAAVGYGAGGGGGGGTLSGFANFNTGANGKGGCIFIWLP